jgi:hypothetical protein
MNLKIVICQRDCHVQSFCSLQIHYIAASLVAMLFWKVLLLVSCMHYSWIGWACCGSSIVLAAVIVIKKEYAKNIKIIEKSLPRQISPPTMFKKGIIEHIHMLTQCKLMSIPLIVRNAYLEL